MLIDNTYVCMHVCTHGCTHVCTHMPVRMSVHMPSNETLSVWADTSPIRIARLYIAIYYRPIVRSACLHTNVNTHVFTHVYMPTHIAEKNAKQAMHG